MNISLELKDFFSIKDKDKKEELFKEFFEKHRAEYYGEVVKSEFILANPVYVDCLYDVITKDEKKEEFLRKLVIYFDKKENPSFYDYEYIIQYVFRFSEGISWKKICKLEIEKKYLSTIKMALRYAGDRNEYGCAWKGMEMVEHYAFCLDEEVFRKILDSLLEFSEGIIWLGMNEEKVLRMIQSSNIDKDRKIELEFYYVYRVKIHNLLVRFISNWFGKKFPEYRFAELDTNDKETCIKIELNGEQKWLKYKNNFKQRSNLIYENNVNDSKIVVGCKNNRIELEVDNRFLQVNQNDLLLSNYGEVRSFLSKYFASNVKQEPIVELMFIYLEKAHGRACEDELKFSNNYSFEVKKDSKKNLKVYITEQYVIDENFFCLPGNKSVIRNINAIIGKNGSGKTTIADMLCFSSLFGNVDSEPYEYLAIFKAGKNIYWKNALKREIKVFFKNEEILASNNYAKRILDTSVIRYSNIFDIQKFGEYEYYNVNSNNVIDISTQKLVYEEKFSRKSDIICILNLFLDMQKEKREELRIPNIDYVKILYKKDLEQKIRICFYNIYEIVYDDGEEDENGNVTYSSNVETLNEMLDWINNLPESFGELCIKDMIVSNVDEDYNIFWDIPETFQYLKEFYEKIQRYIEDGLITDSIISIEHTEVIKELYYFSKNINPDYSVVDLHTQYKSSGEMARILLFARLHAVFHTNKALPRPYEYEDRRNFILYLDEIEAYFHPEWQQTVIYDLIYFLQWEKNTYDSFDNIHVIISSNSPFYLSDLPYSNLIFLGIESKKRDKLFGVNIHTILKDIFMMENCLMGKFAQEKLSEVFKILNEKDQLADEDAKKIEYVIEILGDNILKSALVELYTQKDGRKQKEHIEEKIRKLQKELEQIREKENVQDT